MFLRALGRKMPHPSFNQFRCICRHPRRSSGLEIPAPSYGRVSVLQPGRSGDTSVDTVDTDAHLEVLTQHVAGRPPVHDASAAAEVAVAAASLLSLIHI